MPEAPTHTATTPAEGSDPTTSPTTSTGSSPSSRGTKTVTTPKTTRSKTAGSGGTKATKAGTKATSKAKAPRAAASTARGRKVAVVAPVDEEPSGVDGGDAEAFDRFVEAQRLALLGEREAYTRSARSLRAEAEELAQDREPGDVQFDEESGEGDSMNVERERDLALSAQALASVEEIDRALAKIEQGTYGRCEKCGELIPRERLRALPHASLCVRCKSGGLSRR